uniref:Uncharacterized protein n=1 Tax=Meloidogyne enterolobii TaxID=390850 RepID=A0A6V7WHU8_MELEN|nr:unnamed protein product [Meloidogyne enterolobii]
MKESRDKRDWKIRYTAKFLKVFKDDKDCECTNNNYLFTSANEGLCGVYLQNDTEYLNFVCEGLACLLSNLCLKQLKLNDLNLPKNIILLYVSLRNIYLKVSGTFI